MKIKSVHIENFKRFTDLLIKDIPPAAKLVVVVGPNGCGKSSLFDAFLDWYKGFAGWGYSGDEQYYRKDAQRNFQWGGNVGINLHDAPTLGRNSLYVRTAYRNEPDFSVGEISSPMEPASLFQSRRLIDHDVTVSDNYRRVIYETTAGVYDENNDDKKVKVLREELIGQIRESMKRVFEDLVLNNISNPLDIEGAYGAFSFEKGSSKSFHYKNLSGGEKAAFDLLLDVHLKRRYFTDAVYGIDEIETHLHTGVQGRILMELVRIVPKTSQLWVTTHALGVLRAAQEMEADKPGSVCIIDFDGVDLDSSCVVRPTALNRVSWEKMLSITLDDLSDRIAPEFIVVCEGSTTGNRRKSFDAGVYEQILGTHEPDISFVSGGSSQQVAATGNSVSDILEHILPRTKVVALADRDDKSSQEIAQFDGITLTERNIESYLLADEIIEALVQQEGEAHILADTLRIKADAIASSISRGNAPDDLKSAAGEIYVGLKQLLSLQQPGNDKDAFMRYTMAPLILPGTKTYQKLKADIVDKMKT